jgi:hypothetical protein
VFTERYELNPYSYIFVFFLRLNSETPGRRVVEIGLGEVQSTYDSSNQFHKHSAGTSLQHLLTPIITDTICVQWRFVLILLLFMVLYPTCFGLYSAIISEIIHVQHGDCVLHAITLWYCIHSWI